MLTWSHPVDIFKVACYPCKYFAIGLAARIPAGIHLKTKFLKIKA
jgi:hypothetical protein